MPKYTDLKVEFDGYRGCVSWNVGDVHYHVWLDKQRQMDDVIHRNVGKPGQSYRGNHRVLDGTSKRNAALLTEIKAEIAAYDLIDKARTQRVQWEADCAAYHQRRDEVYRAQEAFTAAALACAEASLFAGIPALSKLHTLAERLRTLELLPKPEGLP